MADGLLYLHSHEVIHQDLRVVRRAIPFSCFSRREILIPVDLKGNILIGKDGRARLTSFGLVSVIGGNYFGAGSKDSNPTDRKSVV